MKSARERDLPFLPPHRVYTWVLQSAPGIFAEIGVGCRKRTVWPRNAGADAKAGLRDAERTKPATGRKIGVAGLSIVFEAGLKLWGRTHISVSKHLAQGDPDRLQSSFGLHRFLRNELGMTLTTPERAGEKKRSQSWRGPKRGFTKRSINQRTPMSPVEGNVAPYRSRVFG